MRPIVGTSCGGVFVGFDRPSRLACLGGEISEQETLLAAVFGGPFEGGRDGDLLARLGDRVAGALQRAAWCRRDLIERCRALSYALRGIAAMEVRVLGPSHELHSGVYGGAVANPASAAARLIASLHDAGGRVAIEGFYNVVRPMEAWEREAAAASPLKDADIAEQAGVAVLAGEEGFSAVERIGARPTAEINGIGGGYQGEGSKTVLPAEAFFKVTFRLVPDQTPDEILTLAEAHFRKHCPPGIRLEIERGHGGEPFHLDPNGRDGMAARRALESVFGKVPALTREGGSIPILVDFQKTLGRDALLLALASPDCRAHAPDENFPLANFLAGIRLNRALLEELAVC